MRRNSKRTRRSKRAQRRRRTQRRRRQRGGAFEDIPAGATVFRRPLEGDYMAVPTLMTVEEAREQVKRAGAEL
jgi:hypothetical protein